MASKSSASINIPRVDVSLKTKSNGQAQYVSADNPPQPTPGVIDNIANWETTLVSMAESLRDDLVNAGAEPGGLIYLVWAKDGSFRIKILPATMRAASAANILRGLAVQIEQSAVQSVRVGEIIEESKLNG